MVARTIGLDHSSIALFEHILVAKILQNPVLKAQWLSRGSGYVNCLVYLLGLIAFHDFMCV